MDHMLILSYVYFFTYISIASSFKNDISSTPPMGWMAWGKFMCNTDCIKYPNACINEKLFMDMVDMLVLKGFKNAGYKYVCIDDCWADKKRDTNYKLQPDKIRFPHGIKYLSDYIHSKGLKFGMYLSYGKKTCMGHTPGSIHHLEIDANTMAEWGADYLKVDGCFTDPIIMDPDYRYIGRHCHTWRNFVDIDTNWNSVKRIISHYSDHGDQYAPYHGPNKWFDPDQLVIGNSGLSFNQASTHMAIWCFLSAPLMMSNDLRSIDRQYIQILQHPELIALNKDPLGVMGTRKYKDDFIEIWTKPLAYPPGSYSLLFYNPLLSHTWESFMNSSHNITLRNMNLGCGGDKCNFRLKLIYENRYAYQNTNTSQRDIKTDGKIIGIDTFIDWVSVGPESVLIFKAIIQK
ncbi:unnamed protein product [Gordionus sp. m RMFG-2023]